MSKSVRRLGRGLDSLVTNLRSATVPPPSPVASPETKPEVPPVQQPVSPPTKPAFEPSPVIEETAGTIVPNKKHAHDLSTLLLDINYLRPNPLQPRNIINDKDLLSLSDSIKVNGFLQPITARLVSGRYEIIAGERRWRAAKAAGLEQVPVIIRDATDQQMLELALIENLQREDLNAIDRAKAYREYCQRFKVSPEDVAKHLGEDRTTVINYIRLLDLDKPIQDMVADSRISMGHARCLLGINEPSQRLELAKYTCENGWSVRALEAIVKRKKAGDKSGETEATPAAAKRSSHMLDLLRRFEESTKTKVLIQEAKRRGTGKIVLYYYSLDDFDRLAEMLGIRPENG